ncbi:MAG: hypothetical protein Udaeo2_20510 [Candidatus Udaeobacter sp.]|nr:MAG: hypothetical protein Udaeo2_20510 [Candidatus Udaeobacter sp.]
MAIQRWERLERIGSAFRSIPGVNRRCNWYQEFTFKGRIRLRLSHASVAGQSDHAFDPLHLERLFLGRHKFHHFRVLHGRTLGMVKEMLLDPTRAVDRTLQRILWKRSSKLIAVGSETMPLIHKILTLEFIQKPD